MNVAIIPARSGSKRIRGKNIREFCGKPMVAWSILAAQRSNLFDDIIVSTDCDEIAAIAEAHGASTPFRRPAELADDFTPTVPVIRHAIDWLIDNGNPIKGACCIYATAPFLHHSDLQTGLRLLQEDPNLEFAFSVTEFDFPIQRALKVEDGRVAMFQPQHELTRSQDLPKAYHDAGQFYWGTVDAYRRHDGFYSANSAPVLLPSQRVCDIDTPEDWERAELLFQLLSDRSKISGK